MGKIKVIIMVLVIIVTSGTQVITAQGKDAGLIQAERADQEMLSRLRLDRNIRDRETVTYESFEGNPFLYKDFVPGKVQLKTGGSIPLELRYDIFKDELQFKHGDDVYALINLVSVQAVNLDTNTFVYSAFIKSSKEEVPSETSWFILEEAGKCSLLIKKNLRLQAAVPPKPYQEEGTRAKFVNLPDTYFLRFQAQNPVRITNKKVLLSILSDKRDELNKFIDKNKLGTKDLNDLIKIISYYNSL